MRQALCTLIPESEIRNPKSNQSPPSASPLPRDFRFAPNGIRNQASSFEYTQHLSFFNRLPAAADVELPINIIQRTSNIEWKNKEHLMVVCDEPFGRAHRVAQLPSTCTGPEHVEGSRFDSGIRTSPHKGNRPAQKVERE